MITAGVDIGSVATKAVVMDREAGLLLGYAVLPTGWNPKQAFGDALSAAAGAAGVDACTLREENAVTVTGYGRVTVKNDVPMLSEITCHAAGGRFYFPRAGGVVDIGGQDCKAIRFSAAGDVEDFAMNDKCAAGTGRFIQMTATLMEMDLEEFSLAAVRGTPAKISSMCAVFAESEIVGLLAREVPPEDIAAGVFFSVAERTAGMVRRLGVRGPCIFTGGLASSDPMADCLERILNQEIVRPALPQITGALGAALLA